MGTGALWGAKGRPLSNTCPCGLFWKGGMEAVLEARGGGGDSSMKCPNVRIGGLKRTPSVKKTYSY